MALLASLRRTGTTVPFSSKETLDDIIFRMIAYLSKAPTWRRTSPPAGTASATTGTISGLLATVTALAVLRIPIPRTFSVSLEDMATLVMVTLTFPRLQGLRRVDSAADWQQPCVQDWWYPLLCWGCCYLGNVRPYTPGWALFDSIYGRPKSSKQYSHYLALSWRLNNTTALRWQWIGAENSLLWVYGLNPYVVIDNISEPFRYWTHNCPLSYLIAWYFPFDNIIHMSRVIDNVVKKSLDRWMNKGRQTRR